MGLGVRQLNGVGLHIRLVLAAGLELVALIGAAVQGVDDAVVLAGFGVVDHVQVGLAVGALQRHGAGGNGAMLALVVALVVAVLVEHEAVIALGNHRRAIAHEGVGQHGQQGSLNGGCSRLSGAGGGSSARSGRRGRFRHGAVKAHLELQRVVVVMAAAVLLEGDVEGVLVGVRQGDGEGLHAGFVVAAVLELMQLVGAAVHSVDGAVIVAGLGVVDHIQVDAAGGALHSDGAGSGGAVDALVLALVVAAAVHDEAVGALGGHTECAGGLGRFSGGAAGRGSARHIGEAHLELQRVVILMAAAVLAEGDVERVGTIIRQVNGEGLHAGLVVGGAAHRHQRVGAAVQGVDGAVIVAGFGVVDHIDHSLAGVALEGDGAGSGGAVDALVLALVVAVGVHGEAVGAIGGHGVGGEGLDHLVREAHVELHGVVVAVGAAVLAEGDVERVGPVIRQGDHDGLHVGGVLGGAAEVRQLGAAAVQGVDGAVIVAGLGVVDHVDISAAGVGLKRHHAGGSGAVLALVGALVVAVGLLGEAVGALGGHAEGAHGLHRLLDDRLLDDGRFRHGFLFQLGEADAELHRVVVLVVARVLLVGNVEGVQACIGQGNLEGLHVRSVLIQGVEADQLVGAAVQGVDGAVVEVGLGMVDHVHIGLAGGALHSHHSGGGGAAHVLVVALVEAVLVEGEAVAALALHSEDLNVAHALHGAGGRIGVVRQEGEGVGSLLILALCGQALGLLVDVLLAGGGQGAGVAVACEGQQGCIGGLVLAQRHLRHGGGVAGLHVLIDEVHARALLVDDLVACVLQLHQRNAVAEGADLGVPGADDHLARLVDIAPVIPGAHGGQALGEGGHLVVDGLDDDQALLVDEAALAVCALHGSEAVSKLADAGPADLAKHLALLVDEAQQALGALDQAAAVGKRADLGPADLTQYLALLIDEAQQALGVLDQAAAIGEAANLGPADLTQGLALLVDVAVEASGVLDQAATVGKFAHLSPADLADGLALLVDVAIEASGVLHQAAAIAEAADLSPADVAHSLAPGGDEAPQALGVLHGVAALQVGRGAGDGAGGGGAAVAQGLPQGRDDLRAGLVVHAEEGRAIVGGSANSAPVALEFADDSPGAGDDLHALRVDIAAQAIAGGHGQAQLVELGHVVPHGADEGVGVQVEQALVAVVGEDDHAFAPVVALGEGGDTQQECLLGAVLILTQGHKGVVGVDQIAAHAQREGTGVGDGRFQGSGALGAVKVVLQGQEGLLRGNYVAAFLQGDGGLVGGGQLRLTLGLGLGGKPLTLCLSLDSDALADGLGALSAVLIVTQGDEGLQSGLQVAGSLVQQGLRITGGQLSLALGFGFGGKTLTFCFCFGLDALADGLGTLGAVAIFAQVAEGTLGGGQIAFRLQGGSVIIAGSQVGFGLLGFLGGLSGGSSLAGQTAGLVTRGDQLRVTPQALRRIAEIEERREDLRRFLVHLRRLVATGNVVAGLQRRIAEAAERIEVGCGDAVQAAFASIHGVAVHGQHRCVLKVAQCLEGAGCFAVFTALQQLQGSGVILGGVFIAAAKAPVGIRRDGAHQHQQGANQRRET